MLKAVIEQEVSITWMSAGVLKPAIRLSARTDHGGG